MLTLTSPIKTALHDWPVRRKFLLLVTLTVGLFWLNNFWILAAVFAGLIGLYLILGGLNFFNQGLQLLRPLWPFLTLLGLWHLWTEDLVVGGIIAARLLAAVAAANLFTMTSKLYDILVFFTKIAQPFSGIIPPKRIALAIALMIRFIPVFTLRVAQIEDALRARSFKTQRWRIMAPAALAALDDAEHVALALRARGGTD